MTVKVPGIVMKLGGDDYVVPPLSLGAVELKRADIEAFSTEMDAKSVSTVIDCLHLALRRNYPEITRECVSELVGLENMHDVMQAVMDVSGFRRKALEASEKGVTEGKEAPQLTGDSSTQP